MEWMIDGYNVLIGNDFGHDRSARECFRKMLESHFLGKRVAISVVYDSRSGIGIQSAPTGRVREVYARDADAYIIERILSHGRPRSVILVTNDGKIKREARRRGCRIVSAEEFISLVSPAPPAQPRREEKPFSETMENIERYRRIFEEEEEE